MKRRGTQKGTVRIKSGGWYGSYTLYGRGAAKTRKEIKLGSASETGEKEARERLAGIIAAETQQSVAVASMNPALLTVARRIEINPSVDAQARGTIGELLVAADLTNRGYEVFRPVCAASSCDLAYIDGDRLIKVEVKFATGKTVRLWRNLGKFDVLAIVYRDGRIEYRSHAEIAGRTLTIDQKSGILSEIEKSETADLVN